VRVRRTSAGSGACAALLPFLYRIAPMRLPIADASRNTQSTLWPSHGVHGRNELEFAFSRRGSESRDAVRCPSPPADNIYIGLDVPVYFRMTTPFRVPISSTGSKVESRTGDRDPLYYVLVYRVDIVFELRRDRHNG